MRITDSFRFGQFRNLNIGLVYLMAPDYIDWALQTTDQFYLSDIDYLRKIKTIDFFPDMQDRREQFGYGIAGEQIRDYIEDKFSFDDLKFSGTNVFHFSDEAISYNKVKLTRNNKSIDFTQDFLNPNNFNLFIDINFNSFDISKRKFKFIKHDVTAKGISYVVFQFDNTTYKVYELPSSDACNIAMIAYDDWLLSTDKIESFEKGQVLEFSIKAGSLANQKISIL